MTDGIGQWLNVGIVASFLMASFPVMRMQHKHGCTRSHPHVTRAFKLWAIACFFWLLIWVPCPNLAGTVSPWQLRIVDYQSITLIVLALALTRHRDKTLLELFGLLLFLVLGREGLCALATYAFPSVHSETNDVGRVLSSISVSLAFLSTPIVSLALHDRTRNRLLIIVGVVYGAMQPLAYEAMSGASPTTPALAVLMVVAALKAIWGTLVTYAFGRSMLEVAAVPVLGRNPTDYLKPHMVLTAIQAVLVLVAVVVVWFVVLPETARGAAKAAFEVGKAIGLFVVTIYYTVTILGWIQKSEWWKRVNERVHDWWRRQIGK